MLRESAIQYRFRAISGPQGDPRGPARGRSRRQSGDGGAIAFPRFDAVKLPDRLARASPSGSQQNSAPMEIEKPALAFGEATDVECSPGLNPQS
jgi:hypothetical protein